VQFSQYGKFLIAQFGIWEGKKTMKKRSALQFLTILILILTACSGNTATPTISDEDAIATAVATMLSGLSTDMPVIEQTAVATVAIEPESVATSTTEPQTLLPRSLYYLAQDANKTQQIYRLNRDGTEITQITFEQDRVTNYDISPVDGTIVYGVRDNLITMNNNGEKRQVLVEDPDINSPLLWSPDGKTIVYLSGRNKVFTYSLATGNNEILLSGSDEETVSPVSFSPDGKKLIFQKYVDPMGLDGTMNIYDFVSQSIVTIGDGNVDKPSPCYSSQIVWNTPNTIFCYKHVLVGSRWLGLWQVNAVDGSVDTLLFSESCPQSCSPVAAPYQNEDGDLYFLYGENDINAYPSLSLVKSASGEITNRVTLRPETYKVVNALWTPDNHALVIVQHDGINPVSANMILVPLDVSLPVVTLMPETGVLDAYSLRWGP
jgi:Tol biopolymer transport system component